MTTYSINGTCGPLARWLPSEQAAKDWWIEFHRGCVKEAEEDGKKPPDKPTFVESTVGEYGEPVPRHLEIYEGDALRACIWPEPPAWPERKSPDLLMKATPRVDCIHGLLVCKLVEERPIIACAECETVWRPYDASAT